ncbi:MAG TPA: adenylate/guanylate cyclase domain-containing protein [Candidatus Limnocylindria bacterium]|jgi:class 3 adenylate cyclase/tetratricopeptide (TPR) repeat protein
MTDQTAPLAAFGQERRLVTVLFADFVGFTSLAEDLDPEVLQELVSGIFEDLAEEAILHDGTIEKFIGDAIFVIFGAPIAHEDDPQRALRTAIGMQRVFAEHVARARDERGAELGLRIGVHTGMVVAGNVRPESRAFEGPSRRVAEYGVMGDTVNIASRLQTAAAPGEVLVTQATFRLTNREFSFREVGPVEMKGKDRPILAYALGSERTELRVAIELNAPLVGRWMELSRLDLAYQSARLGRTEVVIIAGEPGIGKSRLVSEFIGLTAAGDDAGGGPRVLRWTFSRVNQRSYAGFIEPLLVELGIDPAATDARERLAAALTELRIPQADATSGILARFLHLPGAEEGFSSAHDSIGAEEWQRAMYIVLYDVIGALARQRPVLYVLEDLHYADSASLDLLWFLASRASRVPLLFLLAQRIGGGAPDPRPGRTNFTQIVLEPLSTEEAERIVESVIEWAPAELRDRIVARAGGNPFFIEESIRALVESGAIARDESGEWVVRERTAALDVPATLHAVVAARLDRLPPLAKECIQLASVIGQRFGERVLQAAGGDRLADAVDVLIAADLVVEATPGERREGRYRFKHAVTQEVAYNTLLVRRRTELHRRVAGAFEAVLGEQSGDFYPALAHHYLLGEVPEKAAAYSWRAAQRAVGIHAHIEALRFAEQALEIYEKLGDVEHAVECLYLIGRVRRYHGESDAALAAYERALALLSPREGSGPEVAALYAHMAELCTRWDAKHPDLDGLIERGLRLVGDEPSPARVRLLAARAFAARRQAKSRDEDWQEALATAQEALAIAEELGLLREVSLSLDAVGYAYRSLGNFREAYIHNQRRIPIARSLQDSDELIDAHNMVSASAVVLGNLDEATQHAREALEVARATEKPRLGIYALQSLAGAALLAGRFTDTIAAANDLVTFEGMRIDHNAKVTLGSAMAAAAATGAADDEQRFRDLLAGSEPNPAESAGAELLASIYGQRESESAYQAARSAGWPTGVVDRTVWGPLMVLAAARWGIDDDAHEERVAALTDKTGHARGRALLAQAQGLRAMRRGEHGRAERLLFDAAQAFATLQLGHERAVAQLDHARALQALGRHDDAAAELAEVRAGAEAIGARSLAADATPAAAMSAPS